MNQCHQYEIVLFSTLSAPVYVKLMFTRVPNCCCYVVCNVICSKVEEAHKADGWGPCPVWPHNSSDRSSTARTPMQPPIIQDPPRAQALFSHGASGPARQSDETSADATPGHNSAQSYGAFSNAVQTVLSQNDSPLSNRELIVEVRKVLAQQGFKQHPCLYCSDENADSIFLGHA